VTHTADCDDCDFRLAKTRPQTHDLSSEPLRPVYKYHRQYPRLVATERGATWLPENLETEFEPTYSSSAWVEGQIVGYLPQVEKTFGLFEALFGIMNDQQVAIGESSCPGRFGATAKPRPCPDCPGPLVDIGAASLVALERCSTARCVIHTIGDLATTHGYYGADVDEGDRGEALTIADVNEVWMFHITPDDTETSAVWVARRIPDNHVSAAANAFVIRDIIEGHPDFLYSDNIFEVAKRNNVDHYTADGNLDFTRSYGPDEYIPGQEQTTMKKPEYSTDRIWRIFDVMAPSKGFKRTHDFWGSSLPFSVEVEHLASPHDVMALNRDHYEGSELDLTKGFSAGPFSSPIRYDVGFGYPGEVAGDNENNMTQWDRMYGAFPRAIGIMRTSWSLVAQCRGGLDNSIGGVLWYSQYQPSAAGYTPLYASTLDLPVSFTRGSLYEMTEDSSYWAFCTVGNWMQLMWKYMNPDVVALQMELETGFSDQISALDEKASKMIEIGEEEEVVQMLTKFSVDSGDLVFASWKKLFVRLVSKYHDGYIMDLTGVEFKASEVFYPRWWLVLSDYFKNVVDDHHWQPPAGWENMKNVFGTESTAPLEGKAEAGVAQAASGGVGAAVLLAAVFGLVGFAAGNKYGSRSGRAGYAAVGDASDISV
jgi:dipeptidase